MKKTLIFIEQDALQNSVELLEGSEKVFQGETHLSYGLCINPGNKDIQDAVHSGFDFLISVQDERIAKHDTVNIVSVMEELQQEHDFDCILIAATSFGRTLAPRLAMKLKTGLCADITRIEHQDGKLLLVRPAFDGKMLAGVLCTGGKPVMASVRPGIFSYKNTQKKEAKPLEYRPRRIIPCAIKLVAMHQKEPIEDIRKSPVLVSAGAGVGKSFEKIKCLAHELHGMISSSRKLVDQGIASRNIQVGQSGKTVSPKLYIALGINGAIQHVEGLKRVEHIISVNANKDAPLCSLSDIVVEGDAVEFAQKLAARIKDRKKINV